MSAGQSQTIGKKNGQQFISLKQVLQKYIYHWPLFVVAVIISCLGAYIYLHLVNPVYEVSATILVKDDKKSPQEKSAMPELDQMSSPKNAETEIEILKSKNLINQVVNHFQLWVNYRTDAFNAQDLYGKAPFKFTLLQKAGSLRDGELKVFIKDKSTFEIKNLSGQMQTVAFNKTFKSAFGTWMLNPTDYLDQYIGSTVVVNTSDEQDVTNDYLKGLDAHLLDKLAPTIGLFVSDEVPERGQDFLNGLIDAYNEAASNEEKRTTKSTITFIDNRLASLTGELSHAEKNVEGYRSSQGITDISSQSKVYLENVQSNGTKLNDVNIQLHVINGIESYINSSSNAGNAPATIGITDPSLNNLIAKLSDLQLKRSELLATVPEKNPMFEPINKQIAVTKNAIKETVTGIKSSLLSTKRELESFNNQSVSSIKDIPGQERQFVDMKRQQSIKENLYVYLLQKREELALSYASNFVDARIVDKANVGDVKWPKTSFVMAIALLVGLGIPFMIIYFRSAFTNKITSRSDIENAVDIPVLGEVSFEDSSDIIVVNTKHHLVGEQFRALRTNLHYLYKSSSGTLSNRYKKELTPAMDSIVKEKGRVTLFTSSISKEGKSFVSINLAASLAASGKKTIILEMDLRKPKLTKILGLSVEEPGISNFLNTTSDIDSIIRPSRKIEGLDIISSGPVPEDPSELLESDRLAELISKLREKYDDIIIDTPPLHLVTDAMIIARHADVSLYVIRQGYTGKDELPFIQEVGQTEKLPTLNLIFNGIISEKYGQAYNYDNSYYSVQPAKLSFGMAWQHFASRF